MVEKKIVTEQDEKREREFSAHNFAQCSRDWRFNKINSTNRSSIPSTEEIAGD